MNENLLEPLKFYNDNLQKTYANNVASFFDELVKKSGIDVSLNRETVKQYNEKITVIQQDVKKINKYNILKAFLYVVGIVACIVIMKFIYDIYHHTGVLWKNICYILSAMLIIILIVIYIRNKLNPLVNNLKSSNIKLTKEADDLKNKAYEQMQALNILYDSDDTRQLILKVLPDINLDKYFNMKRFDYLNHKYNLQENDDDLDNSSLHVLTGDIVGNPYVIIKSLNHKLGTYTYTGELVIYWETHSYENGKRVTHHHSQTLYASLDKPKPYYNSYTTMIYGNEAAADLSFFRKGNHIEKLSAKKREKIVKEGSHKINQYAKNAIKNGGSFTPLGNDEFDCLFGALDRDNETQFRLLFTPLAQKNLLDIMKFGPYGDDFTFIKEQKINKISGENSTNWDLDTSVERFYNYDIDAARDFFIRFNVQYFDHFFFQIAPILSIPLYQQYKTSEYIYQHDYVRNYTSYQAEVMANKLGSDSFAHESSKTPVILKTSLNKKDGYTDVVNVSAFSYDTIDRITYIPVFGNDGRYHDVPVKWVEYIPLRKDSFMKLKAIDLKDHEFSDDFMRNEKSAYIHDHMRYDYSYVNGMFAIKIDKDQCSDDIDLEMNKLLYNFKEKERNENG